MINSEEVPLPSPPPKPTCRPQLEPYEYTPPPKFQLSSLKMRREELLQQRHLRPDHKQQVDLIGLTEVDLNISASQELTEAVKVPVLECKLKPNANLPKELLDYHRKKTSKGSFEQSRPQLRIHRRDEGRMAQQY
mmetsp:Transcript_16534/g.29796  ORF Transcript_16534/g.29796 Transcript_16534/m.29796 type:complete len:135 (-) Transcript_16534:169-573(-)